MLLTFSCNSDGNGWNMIQMSITCINQIFHVTCYILLLVCIIQCHEAGVFANVLLGVIFYCISNTQRHQRCLDIALAHGAEVNNISNDGIPVFLQACETAKDNEEMCLMLLKKGSDPNSKNEVG